MECLELCQNVFVAWCFLILKSCDSIDPVARQRPADAGTSTLANQSLFNRIKARIRLPVKVLLQWFLRNKQPNFLEISIHINNWRPIEFDRRNLCKKMLKRRKFSHNQIIFIFSFSKNANHQIIRANNKFLSKIDITSTFRHSQIHKWNPKIRHFCNWIL